jgi:predicted RNase H-like HicB family nuclease
MSDVTDDKKNPRVTEARQHLHEARQAMYKAWETWLPKGYVENRRKVRKEFLLALRSMVDAAVERIDEKK